MRKAQPFRQAPTLMGHVFIVEDDPSVREMLRRELGSEGYRVYPFHDPAQFLELVTPVGPAVLLLDMRLPNSTGVEVQANLQAMEVFMPVVFMSGQSTVQEAITAFEAGAMQFLIKPFGRQEMLEAVRKGIAHDQRRLDQKSRLELQNARLARLSPRECEVLDLLMAGHGNREIGERMGISYATAKQYKSNILVKMHVHNVSELMEMMRLR